MQIGTGKQGVLIGEYGFSRPQDKTSDTENEWGFLGWIEPACDNPQWVLWFDKKGDAVLYTEREIGLEPRHHDEKCSYRVKGNQYPCTCGGPKERTGGGVLGEPIRLKSRVAQATKHQKEIRRLKDEVEQLTVQLAGCGVAALGGTKNPSKKGDYGWSPAYQDTLNLYKKFEALQKQK